VVAAAGRASSAVRKGDDIIPKDLIKRTDASPAALDDLQAIRMFMSGADMIMRAEGYLAPVIMVLTGDGKTLAFRQPEGREHRDEYLKHVATVLSVFNAQAYVSVSEVWTGPPGMRPSLNPDRGEGIQCTFIKRDGKGTMATAQILRNPNGSYAGLGETEFADSFCGAFASLGQEDALR
jgi:hypothetical protein